MAPVSSPLRFLLIALTGWIHQQQRDVTISTKSDRVLREQLGGRRLRFIADQRVRLAAKAKKLRRRVLQDIASVVVSMFDMP